MLSLVYKKTSLVLSFLYQVLVFSFAQADPIVIKCPDFVQVDLDTKTKTPIGKTVFDILFSHPPGWDVNFEPGDGYQQMPFTTSKGTTVPGWLAGVKDLSSVPLSKLTIVGVLDAKKTFYSRVICQYRKNPKGGFRITLAQNSPLTHSCFPRGSAYASCVEKTKIQCPAQITGESVPVGWNQGNKNNFTPKSNSITPLCQVLAITATGEINCKYCGATADSFNFIKQPYPAKLTCESVKPNNFATCYYAGSALDPL